MVISRSSPPSTSFSGDCASCSTSAGDRYWPNARADLPALRLLAHEAREDQREIDRRGRHQGIGEIDQQPVLGVEDTRTFRPARWQTAAPRATSVTGPNFGANAITSSPNSSAVDEFDGDAVIRLRDHRAGQRALQHLGVDFHAGHGRRNRRGLDVVETDRRGADQHQLARDPCRARRVLPARRSPKRRSRDRWRA